SSARVRRVRVGLGRQARADRARRDGARVHTGTGAGRAEGLHRHVGAARQVSRARDHPCIGTSWGRRGGSMRTMITKSSIATRAVLPLAAAIAVALPATAAIAADDIPDLEGVWQFG